MGQEQVEKGLVVVGRHIRVYRDGETGEIQEGRAGRREERERERRMR